MASGCGIRFTDPLGILIGLENKGIGRLPNSKTSCQDGYIAIVLVVLGHKVKVFALFLVISIRFDDYNSAGEDLQKSKGKD